MLKYETYCEYVSHKEPFSSWAGAQILDPPEFVDQIITRSWSGALVLSGDHVLCISDGYNGDGRLEDI